MAYFSIDKHSRLSAAMRQQYLVTGRSFFVIIVLTVIPRVAQADNALIGTGGLLTVPTAETTQDGRFAWGISYIPPGHYTHFLDRRVYEGKRHATFAILPMWVTLGYLPFLDVTVRLTAIPDAPPPAADIGIYKDGMAAMQLRLFGERGRWPALGIGIRDFYGFGLFPASYVVVTKTRQIGSERVRFHGGWGFPWPSGEWGAVEPPGSIPKVHSFVGPFGGADGLVWQNSRAILEYDTRRVNAGVRWRPVPHTQLNAGLFGLKKLFGGIAFDLDLL